MDILPTNDLLFKKIFTSHGNEDILLEFVNDMLGTSFTSVVPQETYDIKKIKSKKLNYTEVDVRAQTEEGKYVTIEMQVQNHESFLARTTYYASRTYVNQYKKENKADPYDDLKQTYSINVMNFNPFEDASRTLRHFSMADRKTYEWLSDLKAPFIELVYLILPNVEDVVENIKYWRQFFKGESINSKAPK